MTTTERLDVLINRACRHLTPGEGRALRDGVRQLRAERNWAEHEHTNTRETFNIAWEQQAADLERARRVAVALENENRRMEDRVRTLTDGAADREALLTEARDALEQADAGGHGDDWPHLAPGIRALHARAERAEQQYAQVRGTLAEVLAEFVHDTHPGERCKQTGHVRVADVDRWRAALDVAQQPDTARQDRHTGACGPPCCAIDPNTAEHPNGTHADAHAR